ncbi:MAG: hypothetical protein KKI18_00720 [Planctomycetes bacterium]|nr:hypothetical protein [Planctomycetota bacterium]MBU1517427.1 hypothetical protein [Planctomycetota bacterium]
MDKDKNRSFLICLAFLNPAFAYAGRENSTRALSILNRHFESNLIIPRQKTILLWLSRKNSSPKTKI